MSCPEQFRQRYIRKQPERLNTDRFLGIVDHATHATNFRWKMDLGRDMDEGLLLQAFSDRWNETIDKEGEPQWGETDPVEAFALGQLMATTYHEQVSPQVKPIGVEEWFEIEVPNIPVPVVGVLDVPTETSVIERKTAKAKVSKPKSKWRFQGRIYQLATGLPIDWHVVTKQKTPMVYTPQNAELRLELVNKDLTCQMVEHAAWRINDLYARYGADKPWPADGLHHDWACSYCSWGKERGNGECFAWN